jgi:hypothetical protein
MNTQSSATTTALPPPLATFSGQNDGAPLTRVFLAFRIPLQALPTFW